MSGSRLLFLLAPVLLLLSCAAYTQTKASCTFTTFGMAINIPNLGSGFISPGGINDYGTIVGTASPNNDQELPVAVVRWARGGTSFPLGTTSPNPSGFFDRNDSGASIGQTGGVPILVTGSNVTDLTLNGVMGPIQSANGINSWGSIVGTYYTDFPNGLTGFKRWSNGGFVSLSFPGGQQTTPTSINDGGTIVGYYFPAFPGLPQGFIYHNGGWATLVFPKSSNTILVGIDNAGAIIGNALMPDGTSTAFLYENGTFEVISVPGAAPNSTILFGISPKLGLILGNGFVARCK